MDLPDLTFDCAVGLATSVLRCDPDAIREATYDELETASDDPSEVEALARAVEAWPCRSGAGDALVDVLRALDLLQAQCRLQDVNHGHLVEAVVAVLDWHRAGTGRVSLDDVIEGSEAARW